MPSERAVPVPELHDRSQSDYHSNQSIDKLANRTPPPDIFDNKGRTEAAKTGNQSNLQQNSIASNQQQTKQPKRGMHNLFEPDEQREITARFPIEADEQRFAPAPPSTVLPTPPLEQNTDVDWQDSQGYHLNQQDSESFLHRGDPNEVLNQNQQEERFEQVCPDIADESQDSGRQYIEQEDPSQQRESSFENSPDNNSNQQTSLNSSMMGNRMTAATSHTVGSTVADTGVSSTPSHPREQIFIQQRSGPPPPSPFKGPSQPNQSQVSRSNSINLEKIEEEAAPSQYFEVPESLLQDSQNIQSLDSSLNEEEQKYQPPEVTNPSPNIELATGSPNRNSPAEKESSQFIIDSGPSHFSQTNYFGFQQIDYSRGAESIASLNLTNFEDGDSLITAYKKKKMELEKMKHEFFGVQHEFMTINESNKLLQEENKKLKDDLRKSDRQLQEQLSNEISIQDLDHMQRTLGLKQKELEHYKNENTKIKEENKKLREKMKEIINKPRQPQGMIGLNSGPSQEQFQQLEKEVHIGREREAQLMQQFNEQKSDLLFLKEKLKRSEKEQERQKHIYEESKEVKPETPPQKSIFVDAQPVPHTTPQQEHSNLSRTKVLQNRAPHAGPSLNSTIENSQPAASEFFHNLGMQSQQPRHLEQAEDHKQSNALNTHTSYSQPSRSETPSSNTKYNIAEKRLPNNANQLFAAPAPTLENSRGKTLPEIGQNKVQQTGINGKESLEKGRSAQPVNYGAIRQTAATMNASGVQKNVSSLFD